MPRDRPSSNIVPLCVGRSAVALVSSGLVTAVVIGLVDPSGWKSSAIVSTSGLFLVPLLAALGAGVWALYSRFLQTEVLHPSRDERGRIGSHPLGIATRAAPVMIPALTTIVGRGRVVETAVFGALLVCSLTATLEWFRGRFQIARGPTAEVRPVADVLVVYTAGVVSVIAMWLLVLVALWLYDGSPSEEGVALTTALALSFGCGIAYVGLVGSWVPSVPVTRPGLRLLVSLAWVGLATPALIPAEDGRPLLVATACCVLFVAIAEPTRRLASRDAARARLQRQQ